ncbi:glycosyltransferase family 4 protein [Gammaproteobacteria bacterium]|nr:glycosyltransferase family 4 protein [Gammaproteobacteria bacterium]
MKILIIGVEPGSITNFRGRLIESLVKNGFEVLAAGSKTTASQKLKIEDLGCKYIDYSVNRVGFNPIAEIITFLNFIKIFHKEKPDIIMAYSIKPVIWAGIASRFFKKINFFALITGTGYAFGEGSFFRKIIKYFTVSLYKASLSKANNIIFQNDDNKRLFIQLRIVKNSRKISVIRGSGVDLNQFTYEPMNKNNIKFDFLMIARLLKDKGVREYIEAIHLVKDKYPNVRFCLVGPEDTSPNAIKIDKLLKNTPLDFLTYYGWVDDVKPIIRQSSVFVLPSYHEGLPRSVLEAMAIGRPILTTQAPGCKDTVEEGYNGWIVPKKDSVELSKRMVWFIQNEDMIDTMGYNSRQFVESKFDVEFINKEIIKLLVSN